MTLPSSGLLTMRDINVELGRSATTPFSLNDADVRALAGVPSGPYSMSAFYGKSNAVVRNPLDLDLSDFQTFGDVATAAAYFYADGSSSDFLGDSLPSWLTPNSAGVGAGYWFKFVRVSGINPTLGGLSENTWFSMNVTRYMGLTQTAKGGKSGVYTIYIANQASDSAIKASGTLSLRVTVAP